MGKQEFMDDGLKAAIAAVGGIRQLARLLGITYQAILHWDKIPADRILAVESIAGVGRERLRPDLYQRTARQRLHNRRASENFNFEVNGLRFTATVSRFPDGRIAEVFCNNHKMGNQSDTNARDAAIILSFALQHGADIEAIRKALCRDEKGRALGPISAVLDLLSSDTRKPS
jgi:DNA-binding transcriptional regulator YdaS (Cro superfamily)